MAANITVVGVKLGSVIANLASIASFSLYIAERTSTLPTRSGVTSLNVVLHLAILTAIAFGVLWTVAELVFGWSYGAGGGDRLASGWSAVILSLSMTVPLAIIPFLYQRLTGVHLLLPMHWRAIVLVMVIAVGCHLLIYGTSKHKPNGLRERIAPSGENTRFSAGLLVGATSTVLFVGVLVLAYRLVVNPSWRLQSGEPFCRVWCFFPAWRSSLHSSTLDH